MMGRALSHHGHEAAQRDGGGGAWAALLVVTVLVVSVWGAWKLGVMAGDQVDLRQRIGDIPSALRKAPNPQPMPIPTQRRPAVEQAR